MNSSTALRGLLAALLSLLSLSALAADAARQATVDGVTVYLGILPAQVVLGQGSPYDTAQYQLVVVSLFDHETGQRITNAKVAAGVAEVGQSPTFNTLSPLLIGGQSAYGNFFTFPDAVPYHIGIQILVPGAKKPVAANFEYRRPQSGSALESRRP